MLVDVATALPLGYASMRVWRSCGGAPVHLMEGINRLSWSPSASALTVGLVTLAGGLAQVPFFRREKNGWVSTILAFPQADMKYDIFADLYNHCLDGRRSDDYQPWVLQN